MSDEYRALIFTEATAREKFIAAMAHAACMLKNGERVLVTVGPAIEPVTILQRRFLHGPVLRQIAEQVKLPDGSRFTEDIWKEYLKKRLLKPEWKVYRLPGAKKATPHRVAPSTERLGIRAYAKFIDESIDYMTAEWGVQFRFEMSEREAVRYQPTPRKAKESATA